VLVEAVELVDEELVWILVLVIVELPEVVALVVEVVLDVVLVVEADKLDVG